MSTKATKNLEENLEYHFNSQAILAKQDIVLANENP